MKYSGTEHLLQSHSQNNCVFPLKYDIIFIYSDPIKQQNTVSFYEIAID